MKRLLCIILTMLILAIACVTPIYANSAQTQWSGVDTVGAVLVGDNCPIEVQKEVLTFDIFEFPSGYYSDKDEYLAYSAKVSAEYTFYNPTDYTVTATLVFPFGDCPAYACIYDEETDDYIYAVDAEKYDITVNGEAIDKRIRYTFNNQWEFELSKELPKLKDSYTTDGFYSPTMSVTEYTYSISGIDREENSSATVAFDWDGGDGNTRIYFPDQSGFRTLKNGDCRLSMWADNCDEFYVYVIGEPLSAPFTMKCYEDGAVKDKEEISGNATLTDTETMTLEDFALKNWSEDTGVSKVDCYNAVICALENVEEYNYIDPMVSFAGEYFFLDLMRWYEYEITVPPKSSIVNTVTAPIYPEINENYDPDIFSYTYLLSPASTWADFGELEIIINTPYFITENSLDGFTKTDNGYTLMRNGLPSEELEFTLCSSSDPTRRTTSYEIFFYAILITIGAFALICGALLIFACVVVVVVIRKIRKKRN